MFNIHVEKYTSLKYVIYVVCVQFEHNYVNGTLVKKNFTQTLLHVRDMPWESVTLAGPREKSLVSLVAWLSIDQVLDEGAHP